MGDATGWLRMMFRIVESRRVRRYGQLLLMLLLSLTGLVAAAALGDWWRMP
jgi:hypothetical protein